MSVVLNVGLFASSAMGLPHVRAQDRSLPLSCSIFAPDITEADLRARFGEEQVQTALVPWGGAEGDTNEGTVLFGASAEAKLEIF